MIRLIFALATIVGDILEAFLVPLPLALAVAVVVTLAPFVWRQHAAHVRGAFSAGARAWVAALRGDVAFRSECVLVTFSVLVVSRTLIGRGYWTDPLCVLWEGWGLHDSNGNFTGEGPENLVLLMPVAVLLLDVLLRRRVSRHPLALVIISTAVFSLLIETCQLILHVGTFQVADLAYNTLGGVLAATGYWHWRRRLHDRGKFRG